MITNEILTHDIEFLLDTLNRLNEGTVKPELVRWVIKDIGKESERPPVTVIRGLPEPEVSTNLIEERKRLLGEVYIKLAEIRSKELAERRRKEQNVNTLCLPTELSTDKAKIYFKRALECGYIILSGNGYKWIFGESRGKQARLGYFCYKAFEQPRPINKLEELFGVKKLSSSITTASMGAIRADVIAWRKEMDSKIFFD